jgi:lipoic acid synthetase
MAHETQPKIQRKPEWFKLQAPLGTNYREVRSLIVSLGLHTVCREANCPNRAECYGAGTATFLILGDVCTRGCTFCNVKRGKPRQTDPEEPIRVAQASKKLGLKYVVVTSVTRDDLRDGGASIFAETIRAIREINPGCRVEVLIPDFRGNIDALNTVLDAGPDVLNHNLETVERLYPEVRKGANYRRSLRLFENIISCNPKMAIKSGIMVGLGETFDEIKDTMKDLHDSGCRLLTIGQYLAPSKNHHPIIKFYIPEEFAELKKAAVRIGFSGVVSGPLIRSSYQASKMYAESESSN